jgi:hypothetical protein
MPGLVKTSSPASKITSRAFRILKENERCKGCNTNKMKISLVDNTIDFKFLV